MIVARAAEMLADASFQSALPALTELLKNESAIVKSASCLAIGLLGSDSAIDGIVKVLAENDNQDPILRHAGIMGLAGVKDYSKIVALKKHTSEAVRLAVVVSLRKLANPSIFEFLSDSSTKVQKEAARAIHDVPELHSQLPALVELSISMDTEDAVVHRVLNASFRLGRDQDAMRIANFAAKSNSHESMRVEALDMLSNWAQPGDRDRVMNRHQPLADRSSDLAIKLLRERMNELIGSPATVRDKFVEVAAKFGISEIADNLLATAKDPKADGVRRGSAIKALTKLSHRFGPANNA